MLAMLAVVALLVPMLHCALLTDRSGAEHGHDHSVSHLVEPDAAFAPAALSEAGAHHAQGYLADPMHARCVSHGVHCVAQAVLPMRAGDPFALVFLATLAVTALVAASLGRYGPAVPRGPPVAGFVVPGPALLVRFCIARR
ncbi:hypothetical protein [Nocardia sp. NPDC057353]|uniref:hypothetical protein n=1 Tax=Nocardia sp. NPDC057353 TaxID=3346104 RepID=UPI00363CF197